MSGGIRTCRALFLVVFAVMHSGSRGDGCRMTETAAAVPKRALYLRGGQARGAENGGVEAANMAQKEDDGELSDMISAMSISGAATPRVRTRKRVPLLRKREKIRRVVVKQDACAKAKPATKSAAIGGTKAKKKAKEGDPCPLRRARFTRFGHTYDPSKKDKDEFIRRCNAILPKEIPQGAVAMRLEFHLKRAKNQFSKRNGDLKPWAPRHVVMHTKIGILLLENDDNCTAKPSKMEDAVST
eukprot:jgi/Bigna1/72331/fgenesh1_pg.19_\